MIEGNTFIHKAVNIGRMNIYVSNRSNRIQSLLVRAYPQDVGLFLCFASPKIHTSGQSYTGGH
jgi:hypothetical protein